MNFDSVSLVNKIIKSSRTFYVLPNPKPHTFLYIFIFSPICNWNQFPTMSPLSELSRTLCFEGSVVRYSHFSKSLNCAMKFHVFFPKQDGCEPGGFPVLFALAGLTSTDENFIQKAGALKYLAEAGIALVCPDTSPSNISTAAPKKK